MPRPTLIDMARLNGDDGIVPLLDEAAKAVPEVQFITGEVVKEFSYSTLVRTGRHPMAFRDANNGTPADKSVYGNREFKTFPLTPRWEADEVVIDQHPKKVAGDLSDAGINMMTDAMTYVGMCFWYGQELDAKTFPGVRQLVNTTSHTISAGGSGSAQTECYLLHVGPMGSEFVFGNGGKLALGTPREETLLGANGQPLNGWVQTAKGYFGSMHRSARTLVRIKGITTAAPLTDALILQAFALFPAGRKPNQIYTSMTGVASLTKSRATPEHPQAPLATSWNGIPIHMSECIVTGAADALPDLTDTMVKFNGEV